MFSGRRRTHSRHYQLLFLNVALDPSLKLAELSSGHVLSTGNLRAVCTPRRSRGGPTYILIS